MNQSELTTTQKLVGFGAIAGCVLLFIGVCVSVGVASVLVSSARTDAQDVRSQLASLRSEFAKSTEDFQAEISSLNGKLSVTAKNEASARAEVTSLKTQLSKAKADTKKAIASADTIAREVAAKKPTDKKPTVAANPKVTRENYKKINVGTPLSVVEKLLGPGTELTKSFRYTTKVWRSGSETDAIVIHVTFRITMFEEPEVDSSRISGK